MKNILGIFISDIKKIFSNWVAVIVVATICILPSLYARFYLKSSRDPYGNTRGIKVAVVNNDDGVIFEGNYLNLGKEVVDGLKENDSIGRVFVSQNIAQEGTKLGKYYANIIIESGFSQDFITFLDDNHVNPKLTYTVNEKLNAIVPKITDKGASSIKDNIEQSFIRTVNEIVMEKLNDIGFFVQKDKRNINNFIDTIHKVNNEVSGLDKIVNDSLSVAYKTRDKLEKLYGDIPGIYDAIDDTQEFLTDTMNLSQDTINLLNTAPQILKKDVSNLWSSIENLDSDVSKFILVFDDEKNKIVSGLDVVLGDISTIRGIISGNLQTLYQVRSGLDSLTGTIKSKNIAINVVDRVIGKYNAFDEKVASFETYLNDIKTNLNNGMDAINKNYKSIQTTTKNLKKDLENISNDVNKNLIPDLKNVLNEIYSLSYKGNDKLQDIELGLPEFEQGVNSGINIISTIIEKLETLQKDLPGIQGNVSKADKGLQTIKNDDFINKFLQVALLDPQSFADFFTAPIELVEYKLFSIPNYGSAMAPFFTPLAIWIGGLLMIALFSVGVVDNKYRNSKNYEKFFGKRLLFLLVSIVQGLIVSLGEVFLLGVYVQNIGAFFLSVFFCSVVFSMVSYSCVRCFGNAGKAILIIFLVLQLSGAGGTFPVEMSGHFFQVINPFLPFTYAINSIREAIGGVVPQVFWTNISCLFGFSIIFGFIGLFITPFLEKGVSKFDKKFSELEIIQH